MAILSFVLHTSCGGPNEQNKLFRTLTTCKKNYTAKMYLSVNDTHLALSDWNLSSYEIWLSQA